MKKKKLKDYQKAIKNKGIYDERNKLNNLTGSQWKFSTKSVITKSYPPDFSFKLRKKHGAQKPPKLCRDLIQIFSKKNQLVFDPLMGVGGTLIGASLCGRRAIGVEINPKWVEVYKKVCSVTGVKEQQTVVGDVVDELPKLKIKEVDMILTDVPYWNMDKLKKTRSSRAEKSNLEPFNDIKYTSKKDWLKILKKILKESSDILKNNGYMLVFIGDLYRAGEYHILSADLAQKLQEIEGIKLKANLIWHDNSKNLHVYGYPYAFVPSMIHQNILVFRKEKT